MNVVFAMTDRKVEVVFICEVVFIAETQSMTPWTARSLLPALGTDTTQLVTSKTKIERKMVGSVGSGKKNKECYRVV